MKRFVIESLRDANRAVCGILQIVGAWSMIYFYWLAEDGLRDAPVMSATQLPTQRDVVTPVLMEPGPHILAPDSPVMGALLGAWGGGLHHFMAFIAIIAVTVYCFRLTFR